ncbi:MAG: hypothetical protein IPH11_11070 [Ignavibacteriales bacterium]|nr:hypothetical protein [Ignavibacteriales bacterium]
MKKYFIPFLAVALLNLSCYSYYEVSKDDLIKSGEYDISKIDLKNKNIIHLDDFEYSRLIVQDSIVVVKLDRLDQQFNIAEVEKFYESKFNFVKTLFLSAGGLYLTLFLLGLMFASRFKT